MLVRFEVPGYCQPKQRTGGFNYSTRPETRAYEKLVRQYAALAMRGKPPIEGFIRVEIAILHAPPKRFTLKQRDLVMAGKLFPTACDLDNQTKSVCDGMNKVVFNDDRRIATLFAYRKYGTEDMACVTVQEL